MKLNLYNTKEPSNKIGKDLTDPVTLDVQLRKDFDPINPSLMLASPEDDSINNYNYFEIEELGKFYFIISKIRVTQKIWNIGGRIDVLETYKDDILNSKARFRRKIEEGDYSPADLEAKEKATIKTYESDKGFEGDPTIILTTLGG